MTLFISLTFATAVLTAQEHRTFEPMDNPQLSDRMAVAAAVVRKEVIPWTKHYPGGKVVFGMQKGSFTVAEMVALSSSFGTNVPLEVPLRNRFEIIFQRPVQALLGDYTMDAKIIVEPSHRHYRVHYQVRGGKRPFAVTKRTLLIGK
jgi:hypothetical protein